MKTASQTIQILKYLQRGNKITPIEALNKFGCFRLGARIWDLRKLGYKIISQKVSIDDGKRVARYHMEQKLKRND